MRIKPINPIARLMAQNRRRAQIVPPKKGKGSYNRNKAKEQTNAENKNDK
jgi:stalled ribosome alternative rescue factor ArfA